MDECHQLVKDVDYRVDIVTPMKDFFLFKNKALVSATPIGFSDPRFKENGFEEITLGTQRFRTETAAVMAVAMVAIVNTI